MLNIILYEPEIPPNTGNIIRLCANIGATLHLVHPLGFSLNQKALKRAGLDYFNLAKVKEYKSHPDFLQKSKINRLFACTTRGKRNYTEPQYQKGDGFIFGPETRGLPPSILDSFSAEKKLRIPMLPSSRSLNLSNSVAVILYEAWRQLNFEGGV